MGGGGRRGACVSAELIEVQRCGDVDGQRDSSRGVRGSGDGARRWRAGAEGRRDVVRRDEVR
jgi:hypothetical protein